MPSTLILEGKHDDEVKKCEHAVHFPIKSTTTPATRASSFCSIPPPRSWLLAFRLRPPPPNELQARGSRKEEHWSARARSTGDTESTGKKKAQWASAGLSFLLGHHISCFPFFLPMCPGNIFWGPTRSPMPRNGRVDKKKGGLFSYPPVPGLVIAFYWCPFLGKEGQAYGRTGHFGGPPLSSWEERKNPKAGPGRMRGNTFCPFRPLKKDHILIQKRTHSSKEKSKPSTCI